MTSALQVFASQILLAFGLVTPGFSPYYGVYFALVAMVAGLFVARGELVALAVRAGFLPLWLAAALLLVVAFIHLDDPTSFYPLAVILPILLAPGAAALVERHPTLFTPTSVFWALLSGAAGSAGLALFEGLVLGIYRPGGANNPIHFGGIACILGFAAMGGVFVRDVQWRWACLLGPALAAVAVAISGSRGPAVAVVLLAPVVLGFLVAAFYRSKLFWALLVLLPLLSLPAFWVLLQSSSEFERIVQSAADMPAILSDLETGLGWERAALFFGAIGAFLEAPMLGHGFADMMSSIIPHIAPEHAAVANFEHLHSDLADFAVFGGVVGLAALVLILIAPLWAAFRSGPAPQRLALLYVGSVFTVGYFALGLTNAVIGLLPQTGLFGVMLGMLVGMDRSGR